MKKKTRKTLHARLRNYLAKRWAPIPIPCREKGPRLSGWNKLRISEDDLYDYFHEGDNVGLLLGAPSKGLVDVDLDAPEAISVAPTFLPATGRRSGRRGKQNSHYWYSVEPPPRTEKFNDVDGTSLVELRSTGHQTLVPPSIHPSGERIFWHEAAADD